MPKFEQVCPILPNFEQIWPNLIKLTKIGQFEQFGQFCQAKIDQFGQFCLAVPGRLWQALAGPGSAWQALAGSGRPRKGNFGGIPS